MRQIDAVKLAALDANLAPSTVADSEKLQAVIDDFAVVINGIGSDADSLSTNKANKVQPPYTSPTLLNGWMNAGGHNNCAYYKDDFSIVRLSGFIASGTATDGTTIFVLPVGCRPYSLTTLGSQSNLGACGIDILSSGEVKIYRAGNGYVMLDGLTFRAEG